MTEKKKTKLMVPPQGGMINSIVMRLKLIIGLMGDKRVNPWVKLIPIGALAYLVSPVDLLMGIPGIDAVDDAAVLWFGSSLFVELCPSDVVQEHMRRLSSNLEMGNNEEVVDGETTDLSE